MDGSEIARLDLDDVPSAMALSVEAGWNQTEDDWRVFITRGTTFGLWDEGVLVATAAALPYDGFGFVAMVLTTAARQGRGFATALLARAVRALTDLGLVPVLDATPAGRPVYERQGFVAVDSLQRWSRATEPPPLAGGGWRRGTGREISPVPSDISVFDAPVFGARRSFLFNDILQRVGTIAIVEHDAFVLSRQGRTAPQIGPLIAREETDALRLLDAILARLNGAVVIDVPTRWHHLAAALDAHGFVRRRPFTRMALGRSEPFGDPARLFATAGPEFG